MTVTDAIARNRADLKMIKEEPFNAEAPPAGLQTDTTPTTLHYVRSNFALPDHDGTLRIGGAVENPLTLTVDDLRALPAVEHVVTLECAGNGRLDMRPLPTGEPWGGYAVSTARWTGARLADVLATARPAANGIELRCQGADHGQYHLSSIFETDNADITFVRSLSLAHAADPASEILIAYEMNGEPLVADHGAPFRLVVPHWYAVASVKWLHRLDVITEPFAGEFQTGHYVYQWADKPFEPVTLMRVRARITDPADTSTIPAGKYVIRGKAWSGSGAITEVGLSFTGESEWSPAVLEPPKGPFQWQDWSYEWEATPGRHSLRARATDASGNTQPEVPPWNRLGYGNNAVEVTFVEVR